MTNILTLIANILNQAKAAPLLSWQWYLSGIVGSIIVISIGLFTVDLRERDSVEALSILSGMSFIFGPLGLGLSVAVLGFVLLFTTVFIFGTLISKILNGLVQLTQKKENVFPNSPKSREVLEIKQKNISNIIYLSNRNK